MEFGAKSHVGRVRAANQDAYLASGNKFAVADGMGGHQAGEVASEMAIEVLRNFPWGGNPEIDLRGALQAANRRVWQASLSKPEWQGMGTTVTCALVQDGLVHLGHIGDSRAYLVRGSEICQLTQDHSVVGELVRAGGLAEEEAKHHPQRHLLTRALGTAENVEIDVQKFTVKRGDLLLLCTDGLTSMVDDEEILSYASKPPQQMVEELIELANGRGGLDNTTIVAVCI